MRAVSKARDAIKSLNRAGKKAGRSGAHNEAACAFADAKKLKKATRGGANATALNKLVKLVHKKEKDIERLLKRIKIADTKLKEERQQEAFSFHHLFLNEELRQKGMVDFERECHQEELQKAHISGTALQPQETQPLSLLIPHIDKQPYLDMSMAYGLLRCPICCYNEGDRCPTHNMGGPA